MSAEQTTTQLARLYVAAVRLRQLVRRELEMTQNEATAFEYMRLHHPTAVRASDLATFCGISRSAMTKLLDQLELEGRITRTRSSRDRRSIDVQITPTFLARLDARLQELAGGLLPVLGRLDATGIGPLLQFLHDLAGAVDRISDDAELRFEPDAPRAQEVVSR